MDKDGPRNHVLGGGLDRARGKGSFDGVGVPHYAAFRQNSLTICFIIIVKYN